MRYVIVGVADVDVADVIGGMWCVWGLGQRTQLHNCGIERKKIRN